MTLLAVVAVAANMQLSPTLKPIDLRCEYLVDPLGIDVQKPRFYWKLDYYNPDMRRLKDLRQTAYQVLVASDPGKLGKNEGDVWDSGVVQSGETIHIEYAGKAL